MVLLFEEHDDFDKKFGDFWKHVDENVSYLLNSISLFYLFTPLLNIIFFLIRVQ